MPAQRARAGVNVHAPGGAGVRATACTSRMTPSPPLKRPEPPEPSRSENSRSSTGYLHAQCHVSTHEYLHAIPVAARRRARSPVASDGAADHRGC